MTRVQRGRSKLLHISNYLHGRVAACQVDGMWIISDLRDALDAWGIVVRIRAEEF